MGRLSEVQVEAYLRREVRKSGGMCIKFAPVEAGVPDRIVLMPEGRIYLVELKSPGGRIRPIQRVWHKRAKEIGINVVILSDKDEIDTWLEEL